MGFFGPAIFLRIIDWKEFIGDVVALGQGPGGIFDGFLKAPFTR